MVRAARLVTEVLTSDRAGIVRQQVPDQLVWVHNELTAFFSLLDQGCLLRDSGTDLRRSRYCVLAGTQAISLGTRRIDRLSFASNSHSSGFRYAFKQD
jgi:hypothetical protein